LVYAAVVANQRWGVLETVYICISVEAAAAVIVSISDWA